MSKQNILFNVGDSLWENRLIVSKKSTRLKILAETIGRLIDSSLPQYAQLFSTVMGFKPSLIIEIGRGYGNSTAVFTEAANYLNETKKVLSFCLSNDWETKIAPKISRVVENDWFGKLDARVKNILDVDIKDFVSKKDSVLLFWDAHGWDISEYILGNVLPKIKNNRHLILVHDIMDTRYHEHLKKYNTCGIWKGYPDDKSNVQQHVIVNSMASVFEEIVSLNDFAERNGLKINSVEDQLRKKIFIFPKRSGELNRLFGNEMSSPVSSLFWFSLKGLNKNQNISFPKLHTTYYKQRKPKQFSFDKLSLKPLISVVTPCYNSGVFLEECIRSVLNQDYPNIEHVIQDGGSTDGTLNILKKFSRSECKKIIKWESKKDNGQSDGLNKALQRSRGEIILVLNADDALMSYACSWAVEHMRLNPQSAVVYGDEYIIDEKSQIIHFFTGPEPYDFEKIFCVEQVIPAQAAFIRRSALEKVGFYADTSLRTCPDYEIWVRIGLKYPMKHVYGPIAKYRWHSGSEGRSIDMVDEMINAKQTVMKRVFQNKTSNKYFLLKNRAYSNVFEWASKVSAQLGDRKKTFLLLLRSTLAYPQPHKIIRLIYISLKNLKILINKVISLY